MHYRVYIDETGSFAKKTPIKNDTDYVAGWVSKDLPDTTLDALVRDALRPVNKKLPETLYEHSKLKIPKHLHFFPLHLSHFRNGADETIRFPIGLVPDAIRAVFSVVRPHIRLAFRSRGFPHFFANEQSAYADILRATILQVIDQINYNPDDVIEIRIAARRIEELMGEFGFENPNAYEKQFCENLAKEINSVFERRKINNPMSLTIRSARKEIGLAVADFFCGSFRWTKDDYLKEFPPGSTKEFNIHNAFVYVSKRRISQIRHLFDNDHAQGLLQAFCHLSGNPSDHEINLLTDGFIRKCERNDFQVFASHLETYLRDQIVDNPYRYQCLDSVEKLLNSIQPRIKGDRVQAVVQSYRIKLTGHRGDTDLVSVNRHIEFLDSKGPEVFGSRYLSAQERVEALLSAVQPAAFNRFRFEDVEDYLLDEHKRYLTTFPDRHTGTDETLARLEGTIGQMFGFLCDYPGQEGYYEDALRHLKSDVACCEKNSPFWTQGMGYLTTLFFKQGDFENAADSFLSETGRNGVNPANILDLAQTAAFDCDRNDFFLLHRLYLSALALKMGMPVSGENRLREKILSSPSPDLYPRFQSLKWLGVIFAMKGEIQKTIDLFLTGIGGSEQNFTIEAIKLPLKILLHWAHKKTGGKSDFDLSSELDKLERMEPGIRENMIRLGIDEYFSYDDSWEPYQIAALMPYYFS